MPARRKKGMLAARHASPQERIAGRTNHSAQMNETTSDGMQQDRRRTGTDGSAANKWSGGEEETRAQSEMAHTERLGRGQLSRAAVMSRGESLHRRRQQEQPWTKKHSIAAARGRPRGG
eukprot:scaffold9569_cov142-Isochrysis_galbana.AAC.3